MSGTDRKAEIVRELVCDVRFGIVLGIVLGLYDVSLTIMMHYRQIIFQRPLSVMSFLSAGFIGYLLICVPAMLAIGALWQILHRVPWQRLQRLDRSFFYLTTFIIAPSALLLLAYLWRQTVPWLPITNGLVMSYTAGVFLIALCGWVILYQILKAAIVFLSGRKILSLFKRKLVKQAGLLLPAIFLVIAAGIHLVELHSTKLAGKGISPRNSEIITNDGAVGGGRNTNELPSILFISIESLRSDHVNRCGYQERETTPFLDKLSEKGVLFPNSFTQSSWTKPSMASIFSSQYLENHHVNIQRGLSEETQTLPRILRDLGYQTCSIHFNPNLVDPAFGFEDIYANEELVNNINYVSPILPFRLKIGRVIFPLRIDRFLPKFPWDYKHWWVDAKRMNQAAIEWLKKNRSTGGRPFFLHIHYNEPHGPYFRHPPKTIVFDFPIGLNREAFLRRYDSEICFVDKAIGELLSFIFGFSDPNKTLIVITADHGQEFMDHGSYGHGKTLFDEVVRVPLILVYPDKIRMGKIIASDIRSIDITPTVLELVGFDAPSFFQGTSLMPLINGTEKGSRVVYSQLEFDLSRYDSVRQDGYKLIRGEVLNGLVQLDFLYDLKNDPGETRNIIDEKSNVAKSLIVKLNSWKTLMTVRHKREGVRKDYSSDEEKILRSLGYVE